MVVKAEVLRERLAALRATLERLRRLRGMGTPSDETVEWAIERGLLIASQSLFDIGNHVLSGGFGERPAEYANVPRLLTHHGIVSPALETKLKGLAGFRNLLVHDYVRVDPDRVQQLLRDRLEDLAAFADEVEAWLDRQDPPGS